MSSWFDAVFEPVGDYFMGPTRAARAQTKAAKEGMVAQERMFDKSLATQKPWLETGERHLKTLSDMVNSNSFNVEPGTFAPRSFTPKDFKFNFEADPGYQFRQDEARKQVERSAAAGGGLRSGGTLKELSRYASGIASDEYGNAYNRAYGRYSDDYTRDYGRFSDDYSRDYGAFHDDFNRRSANMSNLYNQHANLAGVGQTAAGNVSSMNMQQGQNLANGFNNIGNAQANRAMSGQNTVNPLLNLGAQGLGAYAGVKALGMKK